MLTGLTVVFAVHLIASRDAAGPMVFEDEIGYLMNSRAIVEQGSSVRIGPMGFYYSGWSLALVPLTALISDPGTLYRSVMVFIAVLGALQVLPLAWLARRVFDLDHPASIAVATIAALYPGRSISGGLRLLGVVLFAGGSHGRCRRRSMGRATKLRFSPRCRSCEWEHVLDSRPRSGDDRGCFVDGTRCSCGLAHLATSRCFRVDGAHRPSC
ncbi:MAG: hypothetical protein R2710_26105 [Acidimicrobiales bacterium]